MKNGKQAGSHVSGKAPKPRIKSGGTTVSIGSTKPARRGNQGGKG